MPPADPRAPSLVPVDVLREAARQRVLATSLRVTAAEIGMSFRGLEGFTKGARPHPATLQKLSDWYVRHAAAGEAELSPETIRAALSILTRHLPAPSHEEAVRRIVSELRELGEEQRTPAPGWMKELGR